MMPAAWTPKEFNFAYQIGFTTRYSCDGLRDRMTALLSKLGARDVQVATMGCIRLTGPEVVPGVRVKMSVLQPAAEWAIGRTVPAYWQTVDLLADRDPVWAAADCELMEQVRQKLLPLFATRKVEFSAICQKNKLLPGGTLLKAEVLVPQATAVAGSAAR